MGRQIHGIVLILLSICEVWMCYQVLYRTVLEKEHLRKWQKVLIWGNILGAGIILGINRKLLFFLYYHVCIRYFNYAILCLDCREKEYDN